MSGQISRLSAVLGHAHHEGRVFFVKPTTDQDYAEWNQRVRHTYPGGIPNVFNTFETAYAAVQSNRNDIIVPSTHGSHAVADEVNVAKNRFHVMSEDVYRGIDRKGKAQGAKITMAAAVDAAYVIDIASAVRTTWQGVKIINSSTQSSAVAALRLGGEGTYMKNCSVQMNAKLNAATTFDVVFGEDTGEFSHCTFGNDAVLTSAARSVARIDAVNTPFKHNTFEDCSFIIASSDADAKLLSVADTAAVTFLNEMNNCSFLNTVHAGQGSAQLTVAAASASGLTGGGIHFHNPSTNAASFSTTSDGFTVSMTPTATTNAFEAVTPA
jgi:hypothetical protein